MSDLPLTWSRPRVGADLARQVRAVLADLPWFFVTPFIRHWHLTWGATEFEAREPMPGDDPPSGPHYRTTRAIEIDAPPEQVWPWLVQVGCDRGGWYANDLLDNFIRPSVRRVVPELQDQHLGQWLSMVPRPTERTAFVVDSFCAPGWLLWRTPNRTWFWRLVPLDNGSRTRLVTRMHTRYEWRRPLTPLTVALMEVADFPMMRRMLRGIRDRAEAQPAVAVTPSQSGRSPAHVAAAASQRSRKEQP